jgi:hypothetical protein
MSSLAVPWQRLLQWKFFSFTRSSPFFRNSRTEFTKLSLAYNQLGTNFIVNTSLCCPTVALLRISCLATETCLPSCCPGTSLVYPPISRSLRSNGTTRCIIIVDLVNMPMVVRIWAGFSCVRIVSRGRLL